MDKPVTINAVFQLITLAVLGTGGVVGKSAYDDLADRLTEARIEAATLRTAVEALSTQRDAHQAANESTRGRIEAIDLRLTALEVRASTEKSKR